MITPTQASARRVTELVRQAHEHLESGKDPGSGDPWTGITVATLVAQAVALEGVSSQAFRRPPVPDYESAKDCLLAVQQEMSTWDWDSLGRDDLKAGCLLVLDIAELVSAL